MSYAFQSRTLKLALFASASMLAVVSTASAQQVAQADKAGQLEEITVTAQRYAEDLQKTPIAVTAFSADTLAERQVFNIRDLQAVVPGAIVQNVVALQSAPRIFIRGVGQDSATFNADNAVGTYIDGVYIPRLYGAVFDFSDIERLEVLRGPQGTLYGRNTSGGAIKIETKRPTNELTGNFEIGLGTYDQVDLKGFVSGPLVEDKVFASLSALSRDRDGISTAPNLNNKKVNNRDVTAVRGKLLFTPSDAFEVQLGLDHTKDDSGPFYPSAIVGAAATFPNASVNRDIFITDGNSPDQSSVEQSGATLTAKYNVGDFTLTSLSGLRNLKTDAILPLDTAPNSLLISGVFLNETSFSQEFNGVYESDRFTGTGGVYYFFERSRFLSPLGISQPELSKQDTNSYAAYAQGSFKITDQLSVSAGIRYTDDHKSFYNYYYVPTTAIPNRTPKLGKESWDSWTPKFGVEYQANDDLLVYASYSKGFKGGGWNRVPPAISNGQLIYGVFSYAPENVDAYEVGAKFQNADNTLRLNVSAYYNDYSGLQVSQQIPGTTIARVANASGARVQGIEFEPSWQVTDTFLLYGNAAVTDGKYTESFICQLNGVYQECRAKDLRGVAPFKGALGFVFTPDVGLPGQVRLGASVDYSDKFYNDAVNTPLIAARARTLVDALVAYDSEKGDWTLSLEGKNILDHTYYSTGLTVGTTQVVYPNDPRTVTARFKYNF
jgi:iron complex outermembrane receptor protein